MFPYPFNYTDSLDRMEPGADIYAFGICALEMAVVEIQTNSDSKKNISRESIDKAIQKLEIPRQRVQYKNDILKEFCFSFI